MDHLQNIQNTLPSQQEVPLESSVRKNLNKLKFPDEQVPTIPTIPTIPNNSPLRRYPMKDWIVLGSMAIINFFTIFIVPSKTSVSISLVQTLISAYMYYKESLKEDPPDDTYHSKWYVYGANMLFSICMTGYFLYKKNFIIELINANTTVTIAYMVMLVTMASIYSYVFLSIPEGLNVVDYEKRRDTIKEMRIVWFGQESGVINKIYLAVLLYLTIMITKLLYGDEIAAIFKGLVYGDKIAAPAAQFMQAVV